MKAWIFSRPRKFILCIDHFDALRSRIWALHVDGGWTCAKAADVRVPTKTVFKGRRAKQPKAYLTGLCRKVSLTARDTLVVE